MALGRTPRSANRQQQVFTSSSIWNPFPEPRLVDVLLVGGGGGGSFSVSYSYPEAQGGVGGAGGQVVVIKDYFFVGPVTVTIGVGGTGGTQDSSFTNSNFSGTNGSASSVTPGNNQGISVAAQGGNSGGFDAYSAGSNPNKYAGGALTDSRLPYFEARVNGAQGSSSSGGVTSYARPENGKVFGNRFATTNYLQTAFTEQGPPATSGYPYGAGGGAGFLSGYNTQYAPAQAVNIPYLAKGSYGSGSGLGGSVDATPNSGGGGGSAGDTSMSNVNLYGSARGGNGGSGIIVFAWND